FGLDGIWRGDVPPAPGMPVTVEFAAGGVIAGITPIAESQIAKEQAEVVMKAAKERGGALASAAVARFGLPLLIATGLLIFGWFILSAVSVQTMFGKLTFTFWQILGLLNAESPLETLMSGHRGPSAGFYGFLAIVAMAGPFLRFFWQDKRASIGGF